MARRLRISGIVQGVGYRAALAEHAQSLHLAGWVRNRRDGSVEALVAGPEEKLDAIVAWARRGPPLSRVSEVSVEPVDESDADHRPGQFEIRPTL